MNAALVMIGDELLDGRVLDTNSAFFAGRLRELGIPVSVVLISSDELDAIQAKLRFAMSEAQVLIVAGGIGPTGDDRTREAVADFVACELVEDPEAWREILDFFKERGIKASASNRRQALLPEGARRLSNAIGTAPGFELAAQGGYRIFVLPGVPREARRMFDEAVAPALAGLGRDLCHRRSLCFSGISESRLGELCAPLFKEQKGRKLGMTAARGMIKLWLTGSRSEVEAMQKEILSQAAIFYLGEGELELEDFVVRRLIKHGISLALAESCTAGGISARLARVPGISAVFEEGRVCYSNAAKTRLLGVDPVLLSEHGAVSEACAVAMVEGLMAASGARLCASVTGIAGPGGGTSQRPVGLVHFATGHGTKTWHLERRYGDIGRTCIQERAASDLLLLIMKSMDACGIPRD